MSGDLALVVVLQLIGVVTIIAEFILPSGGLLTVASLAVFGYSLYHVFQSVSPMAGTILVAVDAVMIPLLVIVGMKVVANSPLSLKKALSRDQGVSSQDAALRNLIGRRGEVLSPLRPSGRALIDGKRFDVVSGGDYIDKGARIVVTEVNGNRIVVNIADD